jgi:hypothetical protein
MSTWKRVTRGKPCSVCGKPDWCLTLEDGSAVICPRIESKKFINGSGYLHVLKETECRMTKQSQRRRNYQNITK